MLRDAFVVLVLALVGLWSPSASAVQALTTYVANLDGYIDIAPDGAVQAYSLPSLLASDNRALVHAIDRRIRSWRFVPVTAQDGRAVVARVRVGIALHATVGPDGKDMVVSVSDVRFYDPPLPTPSGKQAANLTPPIYPGEPMRADVGANLSLLFKFHADGRVIERDIATMELLLPRAITQGQEARYAKAFRQATLVAAQNWVFPPNYRSTCGQPCVLAVPVRFSAPCSCSGGGFWSGLKVIPMPPVPWVTDRASIVSLDAGGARASAVQLADPAQAEGQL